MLQAEGTERDVRAAIGLLKRAALGHRYSETAVTTIYDADGKVIQTSRTVTERYCPPNPTAIVEFLRLTGWNEP
ncbi:MAG: hypothetical protein ABFE01_12295 [Phycisphaerales bacterium]